MTLTTRSTVLPLSLAALLLAGGCHSTNQQAPAPQPDQQQSQQVPNQAGQQAMNPGATPTRQAPEPSRRSEYPNRQQTPYQNQQQTRYPNQQSQQPAYAQPEQRAPSVIPAGTHLVVTLGQTINSKTSQPGDSFNATLAEPVVVQGVTLIRAGAPASGTVVDAKSLGRFKGQAELAIRLDTVRAEGRSYQVASSTVERVEQGKGKRTAVMTGGGGGLGALIGGLAGGGKGALIGGLAGAGAGGAGSAFTGNKELEIPAETRLTFRVEHDVTLR